MASFVRGGHALVPQSGAVSVWSPTMMGGRHVCGLAGWGVERDHGDPELQITRLTVDLFSPVPMTSIELHTTVVRGGRRIKVVDVNLVADGKVVTRATAELLRRGDHPETARPSAAAWDAPAPEDVPRPTSPGMATAAGPFRPPVPPDPSPSCSPRTRPASGRPSIACCRRPCRPCDWGSIHPIFPVPTPRS